MNRAVLLTAALLLPLAGCLGFPEGSVAPGDSVSATFTVTDLETGQVLIFDESAQFVVGSGEAGLGFSFERQLIGLANGATATVEVRNDPTLQWGDEVRVNGLFEDALIGSIEEDRFIQFFGELNVGDRFTPQQSFYEFQVMDIADGMVTYRAMPEEGQEDPLPQLGAKVVTTVDETRELLIQRLIANPGETFVIQPPNPFNPNTLLGLEPGAYLAVGNDGDELVYDFGGNGNPAVLGHDLRVDVTINAITPGSGDSGPEPVDGNYGVRASPVMNGSPSGDVNYGPQSEAEHDAMNSGDEHTH